MLLLLESHVILIIFFWFSINRHPDLEDPLAAVKNLILHFARFKVSGDKDDLTRLDHRFPVVTKLVAGKSNAHISLTTLHTTSETPKRITRVLRRCSVLSLIHI